ncbi:MAG: DNA polymerase III subunit alpha [Gammaproteobacteria bacterium]|nr:DNA polymerase III subunit alpha [Gammaproteobacteria bacterium]
MSLPFVHLRAHSDYSVVDGLLKTKPLMAQLKALGMPAVALTDECNLFAAVKFYKAAMAANIKPIFGSDLWITHEEMTFRLTLLCQNLKGFHALTELISRGYLEGDRPDGVIPVISKAWLTPESVEGLIALSGGCDGEIGRKILNQDLMGAESALKEMLTLFPDQRFYLELHRLGFKGEGVYIEAALALAEREQVPVVATNAVCFLAQDEFDAHEVRVCIGAGYTLEDEKRPKRYRETQYLKSPQEMAECFADIPEALINTVEIAKRCTVQLTLNKTYLPNFPVPKGMTIESYFRATSMQGLKDRMKEIEAHHPGVDRAVYEARLALELDVIVSMGFAGYFLIVADFIAWSKSQGIPVGPGRGSGAGSLVAYALKITGIDPLPYELLFERFLNPERVSMPDFDIDFCMEGRDRVIDYVMQKYGRDSVSQIITFGSMAAKAVVRDVGRVLALPYGFVDSIAKLIPFELGITLEKALQDEEALRQKYENDEEVKPLIDMALKLEGTVRNIGKHAGGVVIAPSKLTDFTPIYCELGSKQLMSQFDKDDVEAIGLVKFDFLGLRNLTIIDMALKTINAMRQGQGMAPLDIDNLPLNDEPTFNLLRRCETTAVFQLESRGMKDLIRRLQPDSFEEIIALVALFRPGPLQSGMVEAFIDCKHGRSQIEYPHPDLIDILKPTYGIILYQEQVMKIAQVLAGYTLGGADLLRRAMGKKKPEEMAKQREIFVGGAKARGISEEVSSGIFDLMEKFAGYGFNKSHSAAYALVSYQTAYLKAHYPAAFMAAVLSSDMDNTDKVVVFVEDCEQLDIPLYPPDINQSQFRFTVENKGVRFGLGAIKGVGESAIESIIESRAAAPFADLFDFVARINLRKVNHRVLEALIYAGALDALGPSRESLLATLDLALQSATQVHRNTAIGQADLFGTVAPHAITHQFVEVPLNRRERLLKEKEVLGFFLSGHPIAEELHELKRMRVKALSDLKPLGKGETTRIAGIVVDMRRIKTKRGSIMMILVLEDGTLKREITVFPEPFDRYKHKLKNDALLVIEAEVSSDEYSGGLRVVARDIFTFVEARSRYAKRLKLIMTAKQVESGVVGQVKKLLEPCRGGMCPLTIEYHGDDLKTHLKTGSWNLQLEEKTLSQLGELLTHEQIEFFYE